MESGRFERVRLLASGGMGEVHLAKRQGPGGFVKPVVVKRILRYLKREPGQVRQFLAEARLAALIDHPNVVQVFELGEDPDGYFIVMEYVHGGSLRHILQSLAASGRHVPPLIAARMVADVLRGLDCAHRLIVRGKPHPIVHRDVSPENLMVSFSGVTKVTDFGIAKVLDVQTHSRTGVLKGKHTYLAPEVIEGGAAGPSCDVYAAATVLFELLCGRPPFCAESPSAVLHAIVSTPPADICELSPSCPRELGTIVAQGLKKSPAERFASAAEMCAALDRFLFTAPIPVGAEQVGAWITDLLGAAEATRDVLADPAPGHLHTLATGEAREPYADDTQTSRNVVRSVHRRRVWRVWGGAVAAVTLVAAAAVAVLRMDDAAVLEREEVSRPPAQPAAAPQAGPPPVVADPGPARSPAAPSASPSPPPSQRAEAHREPTPKRVAAQPRSPTRRPVEKLGKVRVQVRPWAEIFLDGKSLGVTPLLEPLEVPAGRQVFVLRNQELGVSRRVALEVTAGQTVLLREDLLRR